MIKGKKGKLIPSVVGEKDRYGYCLRAGTSVRGISLVTTPKGRWEVLENAWDGKKEVKLYGPTKNEVKTRAKYEELVEKHSQPEENGNPVKILIPICETEIEKPTKQTGADEHPQVFYVKCKPQDADIIDIVLEYSRVFIGYPPMISGAEYDRHNVKKFIMDISPNGNWNPELVKNKGYIRHIKRYREFVEKIKPGDYALVPRLDIGIVYIGKINNTFELVDDPEWFEEYMDLRRKLKLDVRNIEYHMGDTVQSWSVIDFKEIVFPLIPRWLSSQLLARNTIGWIRDRKKKEDPWQIVDQMYKGEWMPNLNTASNTDEIKRKLRNLVSPNMFEHLVCSLLQLEYPEQYWFHTGGTGDCGVDGMALDKNNHAICAFVQCKWKTKDDLTRIALGLRRKAGKYCGDNITVFGATMDELKDIGVEKGIVILDISGVAGLMMKHKGKYYGAQVI